MNQRPTGLNVTKAITGFLQYKSAEGLSPVTLDDIDGWHDQVRNKMPGSGDGNKKIESHTTFHLESENQNPGKMRRDGVSRLRNQRSVRNVALLLRQLKR